jgi:alkanesulfonate monooxygenase SsuD/methylene tetrahydromethanopterin reductase-like flavin-dependent oxidoreductase (luciferase family)
MGISVGLVVLPSDRWSEGRRQWEWAEDTGFPTAYTYDHIRWGGMPAGPWHAAYPLLAAAAGVTSRIRLGTLVTSPNFRQPATLAREVVTLDDLSGGRFDLGIGAGSQGPDAVVLGQDQWSTAERGDRFAEFVALLDRLLTAPVTTWSGRYYRAVEAPTTPGCLQTPRVPFTVAGAGRRSLEVAARFGQRWVTVGPVGPGPRDAGTVLAAARRQSERLSSACVGADRDPAGIGRVFLAADPGLQPGSVGQFEDLAGPVEEMGFSEIVLHHPEQTGPFGGDRATMAAISARYNA